MTREGEEYDRIVKGEELVGLEYEGPFDDLPAAARRTASSRGTTSRSTRGRASSTSRPVRARRTSSSHAFTTCPCSSPIDESGECCRVRRLAGLTTEEVEQPVIEALSERELLVESGRIVHRYPTCWRCGTPLLFRVVDDWFIACDEIRQPMLDANATVEWTPDLLLEADGRLAAEHGRLEHLAEAVLRAAAALLPVRVRRAERHRLAGRARRARDRRARPAAGAPPALDRRGDDQLRLLREGCAPRHRRSATPGSTRGSSRSRRSAGRTPEWIQGGYATGAAKGLSGADLPDHAYWEQWFPADWISEMREQIRLWFYSISFMSVTLAGSRRTGGC